MPLASNNDTDYDLVILPSGGKDNFQIRELLHYRDLLFLFVRRDFVSQYKQTILGPVWFFIQPLLISFTFTIVFGKLAGISTEGQPRILFYLGGITLWNYFSDTFLKCADTFTANANLFGKVFFPRLLVPMSIAISNLVKMGVQFFLFILCWCWFFLSGGSHVQPGLVLLLFPLLVLFTGLLGMGAGIIITSLTSKYRDLKFLIQFGVQLLMYASPVVYPLSLVPEQHRWVFMLNPMTSILEAFKVGFLGVGVLSWFGLLYSLLFTFCLLAIGLFIFRKTERSFIDTV